MPCPAQILGTSLLIQQQFGNTRFQAGRRSLPLRFPRPAISAQ